MPAITINDLPTSRALDGKALASIRGAGNGLWTVGWIQPYVPPCPQHSGRRQLLPGDHQHQQHNIVKEMNNLFQTVEVKNSGATSTINAVVVGSLNKNA